MNEEYKKIIIPIQFHYRFYNDPDYNKITKRYIYDFASKIVDSIDDDTTLIFTLKKIPYNFYEEEEAKAYLKREFAARNNYDLTKAMGFANKTYNEIQPFNYVMITEKEKAREYKNGFLEKKELE